MVLKSNKIFTKHMNIAVNCAPAIADEYNAELSWLLQEDIEIVGAELVMSITRADTSSGHGAIHADLSQVGVLAQSGAIAELLVAFNASSTGELGTPKDGTVVVMFPEGYRIPIREEGYLYLNLIGYCAGIAVGNSSVCFHATIYYVKR